MAVVIRETIADPTLGAKHERSVEVEIIVRYQVPNPKLRKRGDKDARRESLTCGEHWTGGHRVIARVDHGLRRHGATGLWQALQTAIQAVMTDPAIGADWESIP